MAGTATLDHDSDTAVSEQPQHDTNGIGATRKSVTDHSDGHDEDRIEAGVSDDKGITHNERGSEPPSSGQVTESKYETSRFLRFMTPKRCRWDPTVAPKLPMSLAYLYAIVSILTTTS